jgi:hypothetical protein
VARQGCGMESGHVHGYYERTAADMPPGSSFRAEVHEGCRSRPPGKQAGEAGGRSRGPVQHPGVPTRAPGIFVAAWLTGWAAQITEQLADNSPRRPLATYNGSAQRHMAR